MWFPAYHPSLDVEARTEPARAIIPRSESEAMHEYLDFLIEHHTPNTGATTREMRRYDTVRAILLARFK